MSEPDRISQFDGVRAIAFMMVFVHHGLHVPLAWMGVDLFFVLSGFLITRNLVQMSEQSTTSSSLATFYFRRVLRIIPPYYVAITMIILARPIAGADMAWFYGFASNIRDAIDGPIGGPLNSMWSIAVEEQFYIVWPWLVLFLPRRVLGKVFVAVIVIAPVCRYLFGAVGFDAVYRLMPCRMDLLAVGALLALVDRRDPGWFARHRRYFIAAACFAAGLFTALSLRVQTFRTSLDEPLFNVLGFGLSGVFFTALLAYVRAATSGPVYAVLMHPALRYVGKISYMGYLVHMFGLELAARAHLSMWPTAALGLAITIAIASASWYAMELPLQRLRKVVRPQPR
jgi:peptidoglycan/LPS O-acetylase OafA/YrhL